MQMKDIYKFTMQTFELYFLLLCQSVIFVDTQLIKSAFYTYKHQVNITGEIIDNHYSGTLVSCLAKCMTSSCGCKGVLFNRTQPRANRCKHVSYGRDIINWSALPEFQYFSPKQMSLKEVCTDLNIDVIPATWTSPCPKLFFSFDGAQTGSARAGNAVGASADNIQFVSTSKLMPSGVKPNNQGLYNPTTNGDLKSYYHLGTYPRTEFCFAFPDSCPYGMSVSFWINIKASTSTDQGFITTLNSDQPGFLVFFHDSDGMHFR